MRGLERSLQFCHQSGTLPSENTVISATENRTKTCDPESGTSRTEKTSPVVETPIEVVSESKSVRMTTQDGLTVGVIRLLLREGR